jgi:ADP-ribose pyrophosphatase YjhB (NUDIX family)
MTIHSCPDKCCNIKVNPYVDNEFKFQKSKRFKRKAGVFIYDPEKLKVLIVQSRGRLWGSPKGTIKYGETDKQGAIRELKEETGIELLESSLNNMVKIRNKAVYYYVEMSECIVNPIDQIDDNDVNGIAWINIDCLEKVIINGNISLNGHIKILLRKFLKKNFPENNFIEIK